MFNLAPQPMLISTWADQLILEVNNAWVKATGYERYEAVGHTATELQLWSNPGNHKIWLESLQKRPEQCETLTMDLRTKSGELRTFAFSGELIDWDGVPCLLYISKDITEHRRAAAEEKRMDRLNIVGEMAVNIGHEIRNPLTTVRGYLQFLREEPAYCEDLERFDLMIEELDKANSIITEYLFLAKNRAIEVEPGNINCIINRLLSSAITGDLREGQHIETELHEVPDLLIDKKEISQLIVKMVENAMEAMPGGGKITIKTYREDDEVILVIQDQGSGIAPEVAEKLGTPFISTKEDGIGLGLAVCYGIAASHNARLDVQTGSQGTAFYVKFPLSREAG